MQPREWNTTSAPNAKQAEIYFRGESYSAFPHLVELETRLRHDILHHISRLGMVIGLESALGVDLAPEKRL